MKNTISQKVKVMKKVKGLMNMKDRVVLITGGGGHIGSVMAEALAELGANIVLIDQNEESCHQRADEIKSEYSVNVLPLVVDLADDKATQEIPKQVIEKLDRMDVLINCAAYVGTSNLQGWAVPFEEQSVESWRKSMEVNLTSVFVLVKACREALKKSGHGSVINIGSLYSMVGPNMSLYEGTDLGNPAAYSAAKGGVAQLTKWLATTLAPEIRVNIISIGGVFRGHTDPFHAKFVEKTPLKRMATEEDLKGAAVYLASDLSNYVTGHNLVVDGGWTAW